MYAGHEQEQGPRRGPSPLVLLATTTHQSGTVHPYPSVDVDDVYCVSRQMINVLRPIDRSKRNNLTKEERSSSDWICKYRILEGSLYVEPILTIIFRLLFMPFFSRSRLSASVPVTKSIISYT